jgi:hypothetical protein
LPDTALGGRVALEQFRGEAAEKIFNKYFLNERVFNWYNDGPMEFTAFISPPAL